ncbi:MAG TPA: Gfo/Idh/MocA family oxidoreductase [Sedimentisphaerales bacterium]|nr:Gfo/Idh/MocA family oxidoreductase [Sedimentisphaerales bacterium]
MSSNPPEISRREFLSRSTQTAVGALAATTLASCAGPQVVPAANSRVFGANERLNMAIIGIRGRGNGLAKNFAKIPNVRVKTICDIDENLFAQGIRDVEANQGVAPSTEYDLRRVFEDKDIDAIATATPNHWHALVTIWALQAGKHVYVEKPCSHTIWEGRRMIEAVRKYNRIVEVGFQSRSSRNVRQAMKLLHEGKLGDIYMVKGLCYKGRNNIGRYPDGPVPQGEQYSLTVGGEPLAPEYQWHADYLKKVHYDMFLGPAPKRPFNRNRFQYNWHWHWDYGNGDIGNQGVHQMDVARWGINKDEHPRKIRAFGGFFAFDASQETANTQIAAFEYPDGKILQFEVRGLNTNDESGVRIGNLFYGTEGWMYLNSSGDTWETFFGRKNEPGPSSTTADASADPSDLTGSGGAGHFENFTNAVRSGKPEDLNADIEGGHLSAALCHMANISYRLGRDLTFDGAKEKFVGDKDANKMLAGFPQVRNGKVVEVHGYRKPYVVPEHV